MKTCFPLSLSLLRSPACEPFDLHSCPRFRRTHSLMPLLFRQRNGLARPGTLGELQPFRVLSLSLLPLYPGSLFGTSAGFFLKCCSLFIRDTRARAHTHIAAQTLPLPSPTSLVPLPRLLLFPPWSTSSRRILLSFLLFALPLVYIPISISIIAGETTRIFGRESRMRVTNGFPGILPLPVISASRHLFGDASPSRAISRSFIGRMSRSCSRPP